MATTASIKTATAGLEDVVIGPSEISDVNGQLGQLIYRGYDIHDLVANTTFEEVVYLLWQGSLPNRDQLDDLKRQINEHYDLPVEVLDVLRHCPTDAEPMDVLRTAVSRLSFYDPEPHAKVDDHAVNLRRAALLT